MEAPIIGFNLPGAIFKKKREKKNPSGRKQLCVLGSMGPSSGSKRANLHPPP